MKKKPLITTISTQTTKGDIPHLKFYGDDLPDNWTHLQVKQEYRTWNDKTMSYRKRPPVTNSGYIVYALPGGGELISEVML